jgi:hypothetical protein
MTTVECNLRTGYGCAENFYCHDYVAVALGPMTSTGLCSIDILFKKA